MSKEMMMDALTETMKTVLIGLIIATVFTSVLALFMFISNNPADLGYYGKTFIVVTTMSGAAYSIFHNIMNMK